MQDLMQELSRIERENTLRTDYQKTIALLRALKNKSISIDQVILTDTGWNVIAINVAPGDGQPGQSIDVQGTPGAPAPAPAQNGELQPPEFPSAQFPGVRGWLTDEEGAFLEKLARGNYVLEIGSYCGLSTLWLSSRAKKVYACDTFDGNLTPFPMDTWEPFNQNLKSYKRRNVTPMRVASQQLLAAHPFLEHACDLVFIDAAHDLASVQADTEVALRCLKPGGTLAYHDYRPFDPGVHAVVSEMVLNGAEIIEQRGTVAHVRPAKPARPTQPTQPAKAVAEQATNA
jgi:SAM-dependent methyltransferase